MRTCGLERTDIMNENYKSIFGGHGSGHKITVKEYLEQLPAGTRIIYVDPKEEFASFYQDTPSIVNLLIERGN